MKDFLLEANRRFDKVLCDIGYDHLYIEAEGDHEWPYWDKAIQYAKFAVEQEPYDDGYKQYLKNKRILFQFTT